MEALKTHHMNGGNGENSYAKNSTVQRKIIFQAKPALEEAIRKMLVVKIPESIGVADLGCSSGPNAFIVISEIIDTILSRCQENGAQTPELRVSLNDLPSSDFNCTFELLPEFYNNLKERMVDFEQCFVSAVPGSFFGRLFPKKSLHCVHSSSSLHWRSQAPAGLDGRDGATVNLGKIYISKSSPQGVLDAYLAQFEDDFSSFLKSRSEEIVDGGCMVLSFFGRKSADPTSAEACFQWELLARAMMAMVSEGLMEKDKVDSFNAPYYAPSAEEVMKVVANEGSFVVNRVEDFPVDLAGGGGGSDGRARPGYLVAKTVRAVVESMLRSHFGADVCTMDILFERYAVIVDDYLSKHNATCTNLVFSLVRKDRSDSSDESRISIRRMREFGGSVLKSYAFDMLKRRQTRLANLVSSLFRKDHSK